MAITKELREKRAEHAATLNKMTDTIHKEDRAFTPEENEQWDKANADYDALTDRLQKSERNDSITAVMNAPANAPPGEPRQVTPGRQPTEPPKQDERSDEEQTPQFAELWKKFSSRMMGEDGEKSESRISILGDKTTPEYRAAFGRRATTEYHDAFSSYLRGAETRALQADLDTDGGFTVASEQFVATLLQAVDDLNFIRQAANVFPVVNAESLGVVSLDTDPSDPTWTGEIIAASEDSSMKFGKRAMTPHPLAKLIKVSKTLLRKSALPIEQIVRDRLAYRFANVEEACW